MANVKNDQPIKAKRGRPPKAKEASPIPRIKRRKGRPAVPILTIDRVTSALRRHYGNMAAVGRQYGVDRSTVRAFVDNHPELRAIVEENCHSFNDLAESHLVKLIKSGNPAAIFFRLKCKGGYQERPPELPPLEQLLNLLGPVMAMEIRRHLASPQPSANGIHKPESVPLPGGR